MHNINKLDYKSIPQNFRSYYSYLEYIKTNVDKKNINVPQKTRTLEENREVIKEYYKDKNSELLMLIEHCKTTIVSLSKEANSLVNFYEKKLGYLEEELAGLIIKDSINPSVEEQIQKRLVSIRSELKYIYDSVFSSNNFEASKEYFDEKQKIPQAILEIINSLESGSNLTKSELDKALMFIDVNGNNFLHMLFIEGSDKAIQSAVNVPELHTILFKKNKQGKLPFDMLMDTKRFFVLEETEKNIAPEIQKSVFISEIKGLATDLVFEEFEYIYQRILSKINTIDLFSDNYNPLFHLAQIMTSNLDIERKDMIEDLIVLIASYRDPISLENDINEIKAKYPNIKNIEFSNIKKTA